MKQKPDPYKQLIIDYIFPSIKENMKSVGVNLDDFDMEALLEAALRTGKLDIKAYIINDENLDKIDKIIDDRNIPLSEAKHHIQIILKNSDLEQIPVDTNSPYCDIKLYESKDKVFSKDEDYQTVPISVEELKQLFDKK